MSKTIWEAAEEAALEYWRNFQGEDRLVDLGDILVAEEITLVPMYEMEPGISGFISRDESGTTVIGINEHEPELRKRFTIAHEIGHYVERAAWKDAAYAFAANCTPRGSSSTDGHEFFANQFAGALLMPAPLVVEWFPHLVDTPATHLDAVKVARRFNVSVPTSKRRLERLAAQGTLAADPKDHA